MDTLMVISKIPIFKDLPKEQLEKIVPLVKYKKFKKGSIVFFEGDEGSAVHFVKIGKVKLVKTSEEGKELIINIFNENNVFGEVTLLNDLSYPVTVETLEDSEIGYINNRDIEELVKTTPSLALSLIKILSKRLYESQLNVKQIALNDAYYRTAKVLIKLSDQKDIINIPRQDLANMVGTARETLSRILSKLKKDGIISFEGKSIKILDRDRINDY